MNNRVFIVGPAWVGDMVMAQSLFMMLKQQDANVIIDVLAPEWSRPIIERMPEVNQAISLPLGHGEFGLKQRYRLGKSLRNKRYTRAIVLPRSLKAALVPWFARIPIRTGYRGEMRFGLINDMRELDKSVLTQTVQRFVALGVDKKTQLPPPIPLPKLTVDDVNKQALLEVLGLYLDKPVIGMMPGAEYGPAKCWPLDYYAELARELGQRGFQVWIFGSAKENMLGEQIRSSAPEHVINLCGKTRLEDVIDLISCCQQVVTNDSGLMHVASATGINITAIYGSSTPDYTPPLAEKDKTHILYRRLPCSPCFKRRCPLGHTDCLNGISVEQVIESIQ